MQTALSTLSVAIPVQRQLFNQTPSPLLALTAIVPARNEGHHLRQTLDALRCQVDAQEQPLNKQIYEVLLLTNNCTDVSYPIALQYQREYPDFALHIANIQLPAMQANIGTVRRLLMDEACRRLMSIGNQHGVIASTDGDTVVDSQWVYQIIQEINQGNDAVGGRILTRSDANPVRLNHLRDVTYRTLIARVEAVLDPCAHDPWPRHFQHFGASIAVTCSMYQRAGRLPQVPHLEDEAFYRALLRIDAKIRKSPHVKVLTSSRMEGRVAVGFSEQLRYWKTLNQRGQCQLAEPAEAVVIRLRNRQRLRACWQDRTQTDPLRTVARELGIDYRWLAYELTENQYFGQLWEKVEQAITAGRWSKIWQPVPITTAIHGLRTFLNRQAVIDAETNPAGIYPCAD